VVRVDKGSYNLDWFARESYQACNVELTLSFEENLAMRYDSYGRCKIS